MTGSKCSAHVQVQSNLVVMQLLPAVRQLYGCHIFSCHTVLTCLLYFLFPPLMSSLCHGHCFTVCSKPVKKQVASFADFVRIYASVISDYNM